MTEPQDVKVPFVNQSDQTLLLVRGNIEDNDDRKKYIKTLSDAVLAVYQKHKKVNLRCVGAAALNNAVKASIIASGEAGKKGLSFAFVPSFQTVTFDGNVEKTALVLCVRNASFID